MSTDESETRKIEQEMPVENPDPRNPAKEEERTLTDHLNKKLLKSFLARMEAGTAGVPDLPKPDHDDELDQNFDD